MRRLAILVALALLVAWPTADQVLHGAVSGRVVDQSRQGLPGMTVTLSGPALGGSRTVVTDASGEFRFPLVPVGDDYELTCAPGQLGEITRGPLAVAAGEELIVECPLLDQPSPTSQFGSIRGRVTTTNDDLIGGASATLSGTGLTAKRTTDTDSSGIYTFANVPPAIGYKVSFAASGYRSRSVGFVTVSAGEEVKVDVALVPAAGFAPTHLFHDEEIKARGDRPTGLANDDNGNLWEVDAAHGVVWRLELDTGRETSFDLVGPQDPGPAAVDPVNNALWIVDNPDARVHRATHPGVTPRREPRIYRFGLDQTSGSDRLVYDRTVEVPRSADTGPITAIACDGATVWLAMSGGLCACLYQLNAETGKVILSFYPRLEPLTMAIDHVQRRLWLAADNGPTRAVPVLLRRLDGPKDRAGRSTSILRTVTFNTLERSARPTALVARDDVLWVLDSQSKKLLKFSPNLGER